MADLPVVAQAAPRRAPQYARIGWKTTPTPERLLDREALDRLATLVADPESEPLRSRDLAVLAILRDGGLRVGELAELLVEDVQVFVGHAVLRPRWAGTRRTMPLGAEASCAVADYLDRARPELDQDSQEGFVLNSRGGWLTTRSLERIVHQLGDEVGVANLRPIDLRSARTVQLLDLWPPYDVAAMLGYRNQHQMLRMFEHYIR